MKALPAQLSPQYVTDDSGEKTAVILPIGQFYDLLEDFEDLRIVAERRNEPTVSHQEALAELRNDGLLPDPLEKDSSSRT